MFLRELGRLQIEQRFEQVVDGGDDFGRRLVSALVFDHADGFFIDVDAADRHVLRPSSDC